MKKETFYEKTPYENFVAISNLLVILSFVYPRSTKEFLRTCQNVSVHSRLNWNCWFLRRGEKRCTRGNTCPKTGQNQQQSQPTCCQCQDSIPGHICGRQVLSPLHHPCSPLPSLRRWNKLILELLMYTMCS